MREFYHSANLYDAINKVVNNRAGDIEDSPYFSDALDVLHKEYCQSEANNLLLGPLNKNLEEFDIGFLTSRPFKGRIDCNPALEELLKKYELTREELEINYNTNLMLGRNSLGTQIEHYNICSYFPISIKDDLVIGRCLKWSKHDVSLSMFLPPSEYLSIVETPEYARSICRIGHMKVFKVLMHKIEHGDGPYLDEFYDTL